MNGFPLHSTGRLLYGCKKHLESSLMSLTLFILMLLVFSLSGYVGQLSKFTLKKFLFLVLFLDRAKLTKLIDHDPVLFNKDAPFKVCLC